METNKRKRVLTSLLLGWPAYNKLEELGERTRVPVDVYLRGAAAALVSKSDVKIPSGTNL
jgi:hypothetical protein